MMKEFKSKEVPEIKLPENKAYQEIKPERGTTYSDSKNFWENEFKNKNHENTGEVGGENKTDKHHSVDNDVKEPADKLASMFKNDLKQPAENIEEPKEGGSYREVKKNSDSTKEVHHTPADTASHLDMKDGPAIIMDKADHHKTASWGASKEAKKYQAEQREKIKNGDFRGAVEMDIKDIQGKFPNKYDKAIEQMLAYVDELEKKGMI